MKFKILETFAGIGAQHKALSNLKKIKHNFNFEIVNISEWDMHALIAYDAIHNGNLTANAVDQYLAQHNLEDLHGYLQKRVYSNDGKEPIVNISRKNLFFLKRLIVADHRTKNLGSIKNISANDLKFDFDLLTYSFPCQDLSIANMGRAKGMKKGANTRSGLLWEIQRILDELKIKSNKMPKYLLLENVPNMLNVMHKNDYDQWTTYLEEKLGYKTFTMQLNSRNFKNPQNRVRVFALSIKKENKNLINTVLDWISSCRGNNRGEQLQNYLIDKYGEDRSEWTNEEWNKEIKTKFLRLTNKENKNEYFIEAYDAVLAKTASRIMMAKNNKVLNSEEISIVPTLTTKQDRHPNSGLIEFKDRSGNVCDKRFITPRESFLLMGFKDEDYLRVKNEILITKEKMYKQAGNSIVVQILEAIFKFIVDLEEGVTK